MQHEVTEASALLDKEGRLVQRGWARQPLLDCNLENVSFYVVKPLQFLRVKQWDYYAVFTPTHFFSATVADIGYAGNVFVYLIDFARGWYHEESLLIPLAQGVKLPRNSTSGDVAFDNGKARLVFALAGETRRITVNWPDFDGGKGISADITLQLPPGHESVVMATPIGEKRFYYNRKVNCLPASGEVRYGGETIPVEAGRALGSLDWGRGVWEYRSFWNWASASAYLPDGCTFGLNMGEGFGDLSRATENAVIINGRVHKLEAIPFRYNPDDYMQPWRFVSSDGRLDLTFTPFLERVARSNVLIITSEVHQMFGRYAGTVVTDEGETIRIEDVIGFAEEHRARW
jgi:hypothetical protein